jgi:tetratricopeptide (TPR) repeat protein
MKITMLSFLLFFSLQNIFSKEFSNLIYINYDYFYDITERTTNSEAYSLYKKAVDEIINDNFNESEKLLKEAIGLDCNFIDALGLLGIVYVFQNNIQEVIRIEEEFIEIIKIDNDNRNLYYWLALIYEEQKEFIKEIELLKKLFDIESNNNNVFVYYNISILYHEVKDYENSNIY